MADSISPTIYLVKGSIRNPDEIFKEPDSLEKIENGDSKLFYKQSHTNIPKWFGFIDNIFSAPQNFFRNSSSYAAIVLQIEGRFFVIPLGMGIHLIDMSVIEFNFGLKVAINSLPQDEWRQMDTTTPEYYSLKTKKSAVKNSTPDDLGINKRKDILKGIAGKLPENHFLGERVEGKDSLRPSTKVSNLNELKTLCKEALITSKSKAYQKDYGWIDNMKIINDPVLKNKLQNNLIKAIKNRKFEGMMLAPPDFIEDFSKYEGFIFSGNRKSLQQKTSIIFPTMEDFLEDYGEENLESLKFDTINKTYKLRLRDIEGKHDLAWPIYRCVVWETDSEDNNKYILSEGGWYEVEKGFYDEIEGFFQDKIFKDETLITSEYKQKESDYNKMVCDSQENYYLFDLGHTDAKDKSIGPNKNEFCDILDEGNKRFIHIKRGKSSPDLGHLFRQGTFSARMLKISQSIREEVRSHLASYQIPSDFLPEGFNPANYQVIFGVILGNTQRQNIPFFSKISFHDDVKTVIEPFGFNCGFVFIESKPKPPEYTTLDEF